MTQVRCRRNDISRSLLCLDFSGPPQLCRINGIVGGEHITTLRLTGSAGDTFLIKFFPISGRPGFTVSGEGVILTRLGSGQGWISLDAEHTTFNIDLSAHPFGQYRLLIKKL